MTKNSMTYVELLTSATTSVTRLKHNFVHDDEEQFDVCGTVDFCYHISHTPKTYEEVMTSPEADRWLRGMSDEINALRASDTFKLTSPPETRRVVGGVGECML